MTPTSTITVQDHSAIAARAAERAAQLGHPVLVSVAVPTSAPVALPYHEVAGLWREPSLEMAGARAAISVEADGTDRFSELARRLTALFEGAVYEGSEVFAFSGGSFELGSGWDGFPAAAAWVPEIAVRRDADGTRLVATVLVEPGETGAEARLASLLEAGLPQPSSGGVAAAPHGTYTPDDMAFDEAVGEALADIESGDLAKVVLARRMRMRSSAGVSPSALADSLAERYPDCFTYGVQRGGTAFVGASPELLVARDGNLVRATPAAGTVAGSLRASENRRLAGGLDTPKSRLEQELVADAVYDVLEPLCEEVSAHLPMVVAAGPVQHLSTLVEGELREPVAVLDLVQALHPTPAVGGVPLDRAASIIARHEEFSRGWYAGPIGVVHPDGSGSIALALRGALVRGQDLDLFAGAGIVEGSVASEERREIELKLGAVAAVLTPEL